MSDQEDELYGDLEDISKSLENKQLVKKLEEANARNEALAKELAEMKHHLISIVEEKDRLEANIVIIYQTALRDVARLNREIVSLKETIDRSKR